MLADFVIKKYGFRLPAEDNQVKLDGIAESWKSLGYGNIEQGKPRKMGWYLDCRGNDQSTYSFKKYVADYCYHIHLYENYAFDPSSRHKLRGVALLKQNDKNVVVLGDFLKDPWNITTVDDFRMKCDEVARQIYEAANFDSDPNCLKKSKYSHMVNDILCDQGKYRERMNLHDIKSHFKKKHKWTKRNKRRKTQKMLKKMAERKYSSSNAATSSSSSSNKSSSTFHWDMSNMPEEWSQLTAW